MHTQRPLLWVAGWKQFESLNKIQQSLKLGSSIQSVLFDFLNFYFIFK